VVEYVELNILEALGLIVRAKKDSVRKKKGIVSVGRKKIRQ